MSAETEIETDTGTERGALVEWLTALQDRFEILDRIADLALGLDLMDRARYARCFADRMRVRNPTFNGEPEFREIAGASWVDAVCTSQGRLSDRVHVLTSPSITIDGDRAEVVLIQQATFRHDQITSGESWYHVAGPLRLGMRREPRGWRIDRLDFEVRYRDGNPAVYALAQRGPS